MCFSGNHWQLCVVNKMYRWLLANALLLERGLPACVYFQRQNPTKHHDRQTQFVRSRGRAGWQPAFRRKCFQPTHFESEVTFGFPRCSSAIADGVSKDAHTTAAKMAAVHTMKGGTLITNQKACGKNSCSSFLSFVRNVHESSVRIVRKNQNLAHLV
jgi:hypothetical protein